MAEHPLLFTAAMVRAVLNDNKTQTRRIVHPAQVGDRIWVREAWRIGAWNSETESIAVDYLANDFARKEWLHIGGERFARYVQQSLDDVLKAAGNADLLDYTWEPGNAPTRKRPSIHMPRVVSRILLEVTAIRHEPLQDISAEDCMTEGVQSYLRGHDACCDLRDQFRTLWDSINAARGFGWDANPTVKVISFRRVR